MKSNKKRRTVFDLPFDDGVKRLSNIVDDVYRICNNKHFIGAFDKIDVSKNASMKEIEDVWYGDRLAGKVKNFINVFLQEETEAILNILSTIFCEEKEKYRKKSISQMFDDVNSLTSDEKGRLLAFFPRA